MYRDGTTCTARGTCVLPEEPQAVLLGEVLGCERTSAGRAELIARVRGEIAAGTYETEEKWLAALDRLLADLQ